MRGRREVEAVLPHVFDKLDENGHKPDLGVESPAKWWELVREEKLELDRQIDRFHAAWLRADSPAKERELEEMVREGADVIIGIVNLMTHSHAIYALNEKRGEREG